MNLSCRDRRALNWRAVSPFSELNNSFHGLLHFYSYRQDSVARRKTVVLTAACYVHSMTVPVLCRRKFVCVGPSFMCFIVNLRLFCLCCACCDTLINMSVLAVL